MYKDGYYWAISEWSTNRGVVQVLNGNLYLMNEVGPFSFYALNQRGWKIADYIGSEKLQDEQRS